MAKRKQPAKKPSGPHLAAAFFCETTIEDKHDGTVSAIRMIDQIAIHLDPSAPPEFPSEAERLPVNVRGLLAFKTGDSPGEHMLRIVLESPSGKTGTAFEQALVLPPTPQGGLNLRLNNTIMLKEGGLFWFHVLLDGKEVTRMPLQIVVQRADPGPSPPVEPLPAK